MVEFRTGYIPMDRAYHEAIGEPAPEVIVEEPIIPIGQLGETVPEHDPAGRFKNIIQTTQAAIRGGAGTVQLVMMTPPESAIGGRPKAYGKEVRETLREVALATGVNIAGVEMPTAMNNLSGFDYQQLQFSEEKRVSSLREVQDAIKFVADVGRGGGIDIVSWEFPRNINDAGWQDKNNPMFKKEGEQAVGFVVDARTGRTTSFRKDEALHIPYNKETFTELEAGSEELNRAEELKLTKFKWEDFERWAKHNQEYLKAHPEANKEDRPTSPEELYVKVQLDGQIRTMEGWKTNYLQRAEHTKREMDALSAQKRQQGLTDEQIQQDSDVKKLATIYHDEINSARGQAQQALELKERIKHFEPIKDYAFKRSSQTYAEAGISAMRATFEGQAKGTVDRNRPLYVGPEIGWPDYFGSHPQEFKQLIKGARQEMVTLLTSPTIKKFDAKEGQYSDVKNPYFDPSLNKSRAEELAKTHVKGLFDTSHMGMWLSHFEPLKDESGRVTETEDKRIERFNNWFKDQVKDLASEKGLIGGIQLVDCQSGAHGHLPPGEGIFPVIDTAKIFKEAGFSGFMVSEGHEEEKFGEGRIRSKLWQHAGAFAPLGRGGYFGGQPVSVPHWGSVAQRYFGRTYSPFQMFGGYSPSNEFKLWSEVSLE